MNVTILGSNGFLSRVIAVYCNKKGYPIDIYGLDEPQGHRYHKFHRIDLMKNELPYHEIIQSEIIVYAIGAGIQSNLKEENDLIYNLNVTVPVKICNELKKHCFKGVFITFGSVFEIGETKEENFFTEHEILTSTSPSPNDYTTSKRMLSRFVDSYKHEFTYWHFFLPTIYGESENPLRLIPYTIHAIQNNVPLHFTSGDQTRQYIYVEEIPQLIDVAYCKKLPSGLYNIQGKETLTVREIVTLIHDHFNIKVPENCFGTVKRDDTGMKFLALDGTKLEKVIGFKASICLLDVINRY